MAIHFDVYDWPSYSLRVLRRKIQAHVRMEHVPTKMRGNATVRQHHLFQPVWLLYQRQLDYICRDRIRGAICPPCSCSRLC